MVVAFVPVRGGSKSIPLKNIKPLCGKPLVYWVLEALEGTSDVNSIYVSTDSIEIENIVRSFGFSKVKVYKRSSEHASDTASTELAMLEFIDDMNYSPETKFILAQATSPMTTSADFNNALRQYDVSSLDSMLSCVRTKRFFWNDDGSPINYDFTSRPRRQDFRGTLMENGAFYISTVKAIRDSKNRLSGKIGVFEMSEHTSAEIDEPEDWPVVERAMRTRSGISRKKKVKLFLSDVDGTLTDSGMYYSSDGKELKKFNTRDGKAFELLRNAGIKTGILTTEKTEIVSARSAKLKTDYLSQGVSGKGKLQAALDICEAEGLSLDEVAYIGDDVNCVDLLSTVGWAGCPSDAVDSVKQVKGIQITSKRGGEGAVREFVEQIIY